MNHIGTPKNVLSSYLNDLKTNFSSDIISGFVVSLLALPLSLGIAKASDFPDPMYGVLTAIIGGMLVGLISGSRLTIKGPAAGLIVIIAGAVSEFGGGELGWKFALGSIVVAGLLQMILGALKLGQLSDFFPRVVINGMLAAIGLIIISKQLHILLGVYPVGLDGKPLVEPLDLLEALPQTFATAEERIPIVVTGLISLLLVLGIPVLPFCWFKRIPVPMFVLLVAIPLGVFFGLGNIKGGLIKFDKPFTEIVGVNVRFDGIHQSGIFIKYVILLALIGSLESLLTVKAIDIMDPARIKSNSNRDLIAVGAGNLLSGVLGGLPMISEVARSSANVNSGAKSRWANFFHGAFLLVFMLFLTPIIQMMPNAALAAMLIGVGIKLSHPREFIHTLNIGKDQLAVFVTTIIFTLSVDLLVGVAAGILLKLIFHVVSGRSFRSLFRAKVDVLEQQGNFYVRIHKAAVFANWLGIKRELDALPCGASIYIDFENADIIDHSVMVNIHHFKQDYEAMDGGEVYITGLDNHKPASSHQFAARRKPRKMVTD